MEFDLDSEIPYANKSSYNLEYSEAKNWNTISLLLKGLFNQLLLLPKFRHSKSEFS